MAIYQNYYTSGQLSIEELEKLIKDKLGDKYTYEIFKKGGNALTKVLKGQHFDSLVVSKNAYHRTQISLKYEDNKTYILFNEATLSWWLQMLYKNLGLIGALILRLIYGQSDEFYQDIHNAVKNSANMEVLITDTGLGQLFKKNKSNN